MADLLPNSLPRERKIDWSRSVGGTVWYYLFCANCGADGGRVMETYLPEQFAFYLCNSCAEKHGAIDGTYTVPDEVFFEKVRQAQLEEFGRVLTAQEVAMGLQDSTHILSKLAKEGK